MYLIDDSGDDPWWVTAHAARRAFEMGLTAADLAHALRHAETDYPSDARRHRSGARLLTAGRLVLAYDPRHRVIITVLWNRREGRCA